MDAHEDDPYEVLGLRRDASRKEIRAVYLRLAKRYHPDRNRGDKTSEWIFKRVLQAYETLSSNASSPRQHEARPDRDNEEQARRERQSSERADRQRRERADRTGQDAEREERRNPGTSKS